MDNLDFILDIRESIYGIPSQAEHDWIIRKLHEFGFVIHKVMWTNRHSSYPNIHRDWEYIGGNCSTPSGAPNFYKWISYEEWLLRLEPSTTSQDWRERLSEQFNEKVKSYGN